ncbi:hypothetical protein [Shewanella woodyi]|uniref:hypothetical protein n=1 Tax=Shewanella woodyi TaxID=60961 RepID=UPI00374804DB
MNEILPCLESDGITSEYSCKLPGHDFNQISIYVGTHDEMNNLEKLLTLISQNTLDVIFEMELSMSLFVDVEPVKSMSVSPSGMVTSYDESGFLSPCLLQLLSEKKIAMFINGLGDKRDKFV